MSSPLDETLELSNNRSALAEPNIVQSLIEYEVTSGYVIGPFCRPPFQHYRINPVGLATHKYSAKKRLILDLSAPHDDNIPSVNSLINKEDCSLHYVKIDDAIRSLQSLGKGAHMCKTDITDAFKLIPIHPSQWHLFGFKWNDKYYFYKRLSFGCRSSPVLFDNLSRAVCWIALYNYDIKNIFHLLDDFLTIDPPDAIAERTMALLCTIFKRLNIPLSAKKTVGPTTEIEYLGIVLDSVKMEARLPRDKVERILSFINSLLCRKSCTKLVLQQLIGHLNFAMRVILPGRTFISHLLFLMSSVKLQRHKVKLNIECKEDLRMWSLFLDRWNGVSLFYDSKVTHAPDMNLYTDASSTVGYGGYFNNKWFAGKWDHKPPAESDSCSMSYLELYPIVVAAILWGESWSKKRLLFHCDNIGTVAIINKGRSKSPRIMSLMRRLTWCAAVNNFMFSAVHVPGVNNTLADFLSRSRLQAFREAAPEADPVPCPCPPVSAVMWR